MSLPPEFRRLPFRFDAERMLEEVRQFPLYEWTPDRFAVPNYWSLNLISHQGGNSENQDAPMRPTAFLEKCPYLQQVLAAFNTPYGEVRLRWLGPNSEVQAHIDSHYLWFRRLRFHIPIQTHPDVTFVCGDSKTHIDAGETWFFDRLRPHRVINKSTTSRIHLIMDTTGSPSFRALIGASPATPSDHSEFVPYKPAQKFAIETEDRPWPQVMPPSEVDLYFDDLVERFKRASIIDADRGEQLLEEFERFRRGWKLLWSTSSPAPEHWPKFVELGMGLYHRYLEIQAAKPTPLTEKDFGLKDRLFSFLQSGAINPSFGASERRPIAEAASRLYLDESVLFKIGEESLHRRLSRTNEYVSSSVEEMTVLSEVPKSKRLMDVAQSAGVECDPSFFGAVQRLIDDGVLAGWVESPFKLPGSIKLAATPSADSSAEPQAAPAPEESSLSARADTELRLKNACYVRLFHNGESGLWIASEQHYRAVSIPGIALLGAMTTPASPREAAERADVELDRGALEFLSTLLNLQILEPV